MVPYFFLLHRDYFWQRVRPAMAECRRLRSFQPCQPLCQHLLDRLGKFPPDSLMGQAAAALPYSPPAWKALVGELLVAGAEEAPRLALSPSTCCTLLDSPQRSDRPDFTPIQQVFHGARDIEFGVGVYRPDHAGYNNEADIHRLTVYLQSINPRHWYPAAGMDGDEVLDAQSWWPELVAMYERAFRQNWLIVCEEP